MTTPTSSRLLAARAEYLVTFRVRHALFQDWCRVLEQARRTPPPRRAAPLCRARILRAEPDVLLMLRALVASRPVPARGVAMVSCLLSDGSGPLYCWKAPSDLRHALAEAVRELDPAVPLVASERSSC